jgi:hypothetical protein
LGKPKDEGFMMTALLLVAVLAGNFQSETVSYSPKPAPRIYVSDKFGLMMKLPSGLSFCALPKEWAGSEDGTVLFLKPPSGCITTEADSSTARPVSGFVPSITVSYRSNIGRYDHFDGEIPPSRTSKELAHQFCPDFSVSPDMRLFGQPALTCQLALNRNKVRIVLMSIYDSAKSTLLVSLVTTKDRLKSDRKVLGKVASAITACKVSPDDKEWDDKEKSTGPVCPKATVW